MPVALPTFLAGGGAMGRRIADHDWSATSLGALADWQAPLRTAVGIMLESRHPMLMWWGPDLTLLYNDDFVPLLGDKHPRALGRPGREAYPEIWPTIGPLLRTVLERGEATWFDDQLLMMDRRGFVEETYWTYSFSPVRDDAGAVGGVFTATNETTGRVVAARRLDALRALGDVSAVGAVTAEEAARLSVEALAGDPVDVPFAAVLLCPPDGGAPRPVAARGIGGPVLPDGLDALVAEALRGGVPVETAGLRSRHPGTFAAAPAAMGGAEPDVAVALPLTGAVDEDPPGVLVLGTSPYRAIDADYRSFLELVAGHVSGAIADARAYEAEVHRARALAELDRAKTEFFTGVSHEFRTPLTLIMGPVEELRQALGDGDPVVREALDTVHRNGLRLRRMVDSLLEFSRVQDGRVRGRHRPVDLAAATADLAALFRSAMAAAGLQYVVACDDIGEPVYVDPAMWEQVVLNLLSNALKFTFRGGVGVVLRREGRTAVLRVTDTGSGIPAEHRDRIFDRFHRVTTTRARSHEGSGIGLALVHQLVTLHGGTVEVDSEPGWGSTFVVRLPLGRTHLPADAVVDGPDTDGTDGTVDTDGPAAAVLAEAHRWLPDPTSPAEGGGPRDGRVLVVDDNADMRAYLLRVLGGEWQVRAVGDGVAALAAVREDPPDLIVSDVMMPGMGGLELVAALRADPRTAEVGVLLLSARAGTGSSVEGLAAGADDYLVKPFAAEELVARVRAQVQLARARRRDARDRLERSEAAFRLLAEHADDVIARHDLDGTYRYVSPSVRRTLGFDPDDLVGRHPLDLVHPDDVAAGRRTLAALDPGHPHGATTLRVRHADGHWRWWELRLRRVHDGRTGAPELHSAGRDVTDRVHAEQELARFRTLVETDEDFIAVADAAGTAMYVNPAGRQLVGIGPDRPAADVRMDALVAPGDRERFRTEVMAAVERTGSWSGELDLVDAGGTIIPTTQIVQAHRDRAGRPEFVSTVARDLRAARAAEQERNAAVAEQAARAVADAAAARLRAMVEGLAAIVAEGDWDARRRMLVFTFVSERVEELLGHRPEELLGDATAWIAMIHPEDRDRAVRRIIEQVEAGRDHDDVYRAVAVDGRIVWLHQVVHVVCDAGGVPRRLQMLAVDVTEQRRAVRATEVLAESGRLVAAGGRVEDRLAALARLVMRDFGDAAVVSLIGQDGRIRRAAVAVDDPEREEALLALAPSVQTPAIAELLAAGRPVHVPVTDDLNREAAADEADAGSRIALGVRSVLVVPLVAFGHPVGLLGFANFTHRRHYDEHDLELAAELGRRASLMVQGDRTRVREWQMRQVNADLASAATVAEVAQRLVERLAEVLGTSAASVYLVDPDRGIRQVHLTGYGPGLVARYALIRFEDDVPIAQAVRTGRPVWVRDREQWRREWPHLAENAFAGGRHAIACLPLRSGGRVVGTLGLSFDEPRTFEADEREFVEAMLGQAAPAFERAATADERRQIAETLQTSLLPAELPVLDRLALAARYEPGAHGTAAGGDWYDVLPLPEGRVALVVGDVVGQGARAAAVMGQLRSALSAYLLEGHGALRALENLDAFAGRVPGATGSTAVCLVVDTATGEISWARAGHPPPLVAGADGTRFLDGAQGAVLGVRGRAPFVGGSARLAPGESVVLYTDGLVERRDEVVDEGLDRLASAARRGHGSGPAPLADLLLAGTLAGPGPADDVAVVVARLLPPPLRCTRPAEPAQLRLLRRDVAAWAAAAGLDERTVDDLQLAVGEAAANAAEHAYRDRPPGTMDVELRVDGRGDVHASVRDHGAWRPRPVDRGYRGRGLDLIRELSTSMATEHGPDGTHVRFVLPAQLGPPVRPEPSAPVPVPVPVPRAATRVSDAGGDRLAVVGDLDLDGVRAVGPRLLRRLGAPEVPVLDLSACGYVASAGVALVVEAARAAADRGRRLRVLVPAQGSVRRILELGEVDRVADVVTES